MTDLDFEEICRGVRAEKRRLAKVAADKAALAEQKEKAAAARAAARLKERTFTPNSPLFPDVPKKLERKSEQYK